MIRLYSVTCSLFTSLLRGLYVARRVVPSFGLYSSRFFSSAACAFGVFSLLVTQSIAGTAARPVAASTALSASASPSFPASQSAAAQAPGSALLEFPLTIWDFLLASHPKLPDAAPENATNSSSVPSAGAGTKSGTGAGTETGASNPSPAPKNSASPASLGVSLAEISAQLEALAKVDPTALFAPRPAETLVVSGADLPPQQRGIVLEIPLGPAPESGAAQTSDAVTGKSPACTRLVRTLAIGCTGTGPIYIPHLPGYLEAHSSLQLATKSLAEAADGLIPGPAVALSSDPALRELTAAVEQMVVGNGPLVPVLLKFPGITARTPVSFELVDGGALLFPRSLAKESAHAPGTSSPPSSSGAQGSAGDSPPASSADDDNAPASRVGGTAISAATAAVSSATLAIFPKYVLSETDAQGRVACLVRMDLYPGYYRLLVKCGSSELEVPLYHGLPQPPRVNATLTSSEAEARVQQLQQPANTDQ